jgi:hypothetical protein
VEGIRHLSGGRRRTIGHHPRRRRLWSLAVAVLAVGAVASGCSGDETGDDGASRPRSLDVIVANHELVANVGNRFLLGLVLGDGRQVAYGTVQVQIRSVADGVPASPGPVVLAEYLPLFGTKAGDPEAQPEAISPASAKGVYLIRGVTFTGAGTFQVAVAADVRGVGVVQGSTPFEVLPEPAVPAPGERAPRSENLTLGDEGAPPAAIDSRAATQGEVRDPELHGETIAGAIAARRPVLVLFSTPVYCLSRFCGPVTELIEDYATRYEGRVEFIHVEIWKDFQSSEANEVATEWLYRNGSLKEPWLFLIGPDGTIEERWDNVFAPEEIETAIRPYVKGTDVD